MEGQREKARAKSAFKGGSQSAAWNAAEDVDQQLTAVGEQVFRGYDSVVGEHADRSACSTRTTARPTRAAGR